VRTPVTLGSSLNTQRTLRASILARVADPTCDVSGAKFFFWILTSNLSVSYPLLILDVLIQLGEASHNPVLCRKDDPSMMKRGRTLVASLVLFGAATAVMAATPATTKTSATSTTGVDRARATVKMLDDIYKSVIVLITDKYVHTESDYPAGSAAVE